MKSARINFGIGAESEYVLEVDDTGAAARCFNPVTGQELGGGGSDLPEVTAADEGKVLAVNASGEWAAENRRLIVLDNEGTLNKTFSEIKAALDSFIGADIYFIDEYQTQVIPVYSCEIDGDNYVVSALAGTVVNYITNSADGYPMEQ